MDGGWYAQPRPDRGVRVWYRPYFLPSCCDWASCSRLERRPIAAPPFLRPGGAGFLLGTDELGRSELARVIVASRIAIVAAFGSVVCGLVLGVAMGVIAAYVGGVVDQVLGRVMDFIFGFPSYVLPILIAVVLAPGCGSPASR